MDGSTGILWIACIFPASFLIALLLVRVFLSALLRSITGSTEYRA